MFMKLPDHVTSFGYKGETYNPNEEGLVDIPKEALNQARMHGLKLPGEQTIQVEKREDKANTLEELQKQLAEALAKIEALQSAPDQSQTINELTAQLQEANEKIAAQAAEIQALQKAAKKGK